MTRPAGMVLCKGHSWSDGDGDRTWGDGPHNSWQDPAARLLLTVVTKTTSISGAPRTLLSDSGFASSLLFRVSQLQSCPPQECCGVHAPSHIQSKWEGYPSYVLLNPSPAHTMVSITLFPCGLLLLLCCGAADRTQGFAHAVCMRCS